MVSAALENPPHTPLWTRVAVGLARVLCVLLSPALFSAPSAAVAQTRVTVVAGTEASLLKDSKDPISEVKPAVGEAYIKDTGSGDARRYELVYRAPSKEQDKPVEVTYKLGSGSAAKEAKAEVTVTLAPLTDVRTVLPASDTVLAQSKFPIEIDKQPAVGVAVVRTSGDPKMYTLAFVAPVGVDSQRAEVLYRIDKTPGRFEVVVSSNPWGGGYEAAFKILFAAFVMAAVIEWALSVIFNWRWFLVIFDAKGLKSIITLFVSFMIVYSFDLDVVRELINVLRNATYPSSVPTKLLSALVIAGGSAGVNSLMVTLGMRSVRTAATLQDKPPPTKAWLAVQGYRSTPAVVTVDVGIKKDGETTFKLLGKLSGLRRTGAFHWPIFRDQSRLPSYGGMYVEPGVGFTVELQGKDDNDGAIGAPKTFGPYSPAQGAIIDIEATL